MTLAKMLLLVGASDSSEVSDLLALGVKIREDKVQHWVLVIPATNPKSHPQNNHKWLSFPSPIEQPLSCYNHIQASKN